MAQGEQEQGPQSENKTDGGAEATEADTCPGSSILGGGGGSYISLGPVCRQKRSPQGRTTGGMVGKYYVCSHVETTPLTREEGGRCRQKSRWKEGEANWC